MPALPPIPRSISLAAGRIPVRRLKNMLDKEECVGRFHWDKRIMYLDAGLDVHAAWLTLEHERVHAILMDAGIMMDGDLEERVCDAIAAARVNAMLRKTGTSRKRTK